jgi:hypothetical protein
MLNVYFQHYKQVKYFHDYPTHNSSQNFGRPNLNPRHVLSALNKIRHSLNHSLQINVTTAYFSLLQCSLYVLIHLS